MNAQELFLKSGESSGVFFCFECKRVQNIKEQAEKCCELNICKCGKTLKVHEYKCKECHISDNNMKCLERLEKAELINGNYEEWVYVENFGMNDSYFCFLEEFYAKTSTRLLGLALVWNYLPDYSKKIRIELWH